MYTLRISVHIVLDERVSDTSEKKKGTKPWDLTSTTNRRTNSRQRVALQDILFKEGDIVEHGEEAEEDEQQKG